MTNIDLAEKQKELLPALLIGKPAKSFISTFPDFIIFGHPDLDNTASMLIHQVKSSYII